MHEINKVPDVSKISPYVPEVLTPEEAATLAKLQREVDEQFKALPPKPEPVKPVSVLDTLSKAEPVKVKITNVQNNSKVMV